MWYHLRNFSFVIMVLSDILMLYSRHIVDMKLLKDVQEITISTNHLCSCSSKRAVYFPSAKIYLNIVMWDDLLHNYKSAIYLRQSSNYINL